MVLFLHNRYRTTGGEERAVAELIALVRERLGEPAQLLERDSARLGRGRAAAGLLRGGLAPGDVGKAVRMMGARVVHAHNLNPMFGWRALAAARDEGARVVLHLHQYRLVCANGVCFTGGQECTRCHGRNTLPGVIHNCRGGRGEALAYGAALAMWQRRTADCADAVIVPSAFARERLRELGAPLDWGRVHVVPPPVRPVERPAAVESGAYALVVSRLAPEKGVEVAIDACRAAGVPLVIAGDGPLREELQARAEGADARFAGQVDGAELARLRAGAALAIVPSRSAETFGIAAAEAMAAGLPVVASRVGALPELVPEEWLVEVGDAVELAEAIGRLWGDAAAAARARERVGALCAPELVAAKLRDIYGTGEPSDS
ncbi:MAG TPA: glycosyltransferase family 4 protein [Solirubrobacteraceae bacterium]|jgi:glycosyltransferase involved in cell wall biosynthesis|nr:glycosyltransferase family 4 protein [Solirubrobacteraceae bacterium]